MVTMQNYEEWIISVPLNATPDELQQYLDDHMDDEPWCSSADVDVSEVDAEQGEEMFDIECGGEVPDSFEADIILIRDANGDLCMKSRQGD